MPQLLAEDHSSHILGELEAVGQLLSNLPMIKSAGQPASTCNFVKIEKLIPSYWQSYSVFLRQFFSPCEITFYLTDHSLSLWLSFPPPPPINIRLSGAPLGPVPPDALVP